MATINTPTGGGEGGKTKRGELVDGTKNEVSEALNIPQELKDFRNALKRIWIFDKKLENRIIKAAERIPVKVETDSDGSRLIEIKLGNKTYKILDPRLENHTDDNYRFRLRGSGIMKIDKDTVTLGGMQGDNVEKWENKKLGEYVKEKQSQGLHIPNIEEIQEILLGLVRELWGEEKFEITHFYESDTFDSTQMLMYLTGMDGGYWLRGDGDEDLKYWERPLLSLDWYRGGYFFREHTRGSLCMISCE